MKKIAIASGKGGTGKTTVAVNLFSLFIQAGKIDVELVDCDVEEPNDLIFFDRATLISSKSVDLMIPEIDETKCTFCRKCVEYCEFNAIVLLPSHKYAAVSSDLCHSCGACSFACKFDAITEKPVSIGSINQYSLPSDHIFTEGRLKVGSALQTPVIKDLKKRYSDSSNLIIFDAPPGTSCPVVETITNVDYVVLVTEPTPFGLHDLKLMVELIEKLGVPCGAIINKAGVGNHDTKNFLSDKGIQIIAEIPYSNRLANGYAQGKLLIDIDKETRNRFQDIANELEKLLKE